MKAITPGSDPKLTALLERQSDALQAVRLGSPRSLTRNAHRLAAACDALDAYIAGLQS